MSRPKAAKDRILDTARRLFAAKGYAGVSMRDIARDVGMTQSSLYNHFVGKQDILVCLMVTHLQSVLAQLEMALDGVEGPEARLRAFCDFHVLRHIKEPDDVFLAYMEIRSLEEAGRTEIMALRRHYEAHLCAILETGAQQGVFKISDARIQTRAILAMLTGVTTWYDSTGAQSPEDVARIYQATVLTGVLG